MSPWKSSTTPSQSTGSGFFWDWLICLFIGFAFQTAALGQTNYALRFDGAEDWLDMSDLEISGDFTLESWVFLVGLINASDAIVGQVGLGQDFNCHDGYWRWYAPPGPSQFGDRVIAVTKMLPNNWTHVSLTRKDGALRLLMNGVVDSVGYSNGPFTPKAIGRGNDGYGIYGFLEGRLDEIRIWNVARTDQEIRDNFFHPISGSEPGLVACWNFDEGTGQTAHDISQHGNDAPLGTSFLIESSDPMWVTSDIPVWETDFASPTPTNTQPSPTPSTTFTPTATATPVNEPPSQPSVDIQPDLPKTLDDLFCSASGSIDPEGNLVSYSYNWLRNGEPIEYDGVHSVTGSILSHVYTAKGQTIECFVTPSDGAVFGTPGVDAVNIQNSPPTQPVVRILPADPLPNDGLAVWIDTESSDADGDFVAYLFKWYESEDSLNWTLRPEISGNETPFVQGQPEISRLYTQAGDYWRVTVTPVDLTSKSGVLSAPALEWGNIGTRGFGQQTQSAVFVKPDFDGDRIVGAKDLLIFEGAWGERKDELPTNLKEMLFSIEDSDDSVVDHNYLFRLMVRHWRD
jgi:hypothetical protein